MNNVPIIIVKKNSLKITSIEGLCIISNVPSIHYFSSLLCKISCIIVWS